MNCSNCNTVLEADAKFCPGCGAKIEATDCLIKVTRIKKVFGFAIHFTLFIDDNEIGPLENGTVIETRVQKGTHKVSIKSFEKTVDQEVTLNDNQKTVEISLQVGLGLAAGTPKLVSVEYK